MIQLQPPVYNPVPNGLKAEYSIDFSVDSTFDIILSGTFQGSPVKNLSIYFDNLNNDQDVSYNIGGTTGTIPAFSTASLPINGAISAQFQCSGSSSSQAIFDVLNYIISYGTSSPGRGISPSLNNYPLQAPSYSMLQSSKGAGLIGYQNSGTNAVLLTLDTLLNKFFLHVAAFGAKGDGTTDDWQAIQSALDAQQTGQVLLFDGGNQYSISKPLAWMSNPQWKTTDYGSATGLRTRMHINGRGGIIQFNRGVAWNAIFADQPYPEQQIARITTDSRQPRMLTVGNNDYGSITNLGMDGNMQGRAQAQGNPQPSETEYCVFLVGCKGFLVDGLSTANTMGDGLMVGYAYCGNPLSGQPLTSSFRNGTGTPPNTIIADNMCENLTVRRTRHYNHARQGISVIGCRTGRFTDIYSESIDSVANFQSSGGLGATIDLEANQDGSIVDNITIDGIIAKNHKVCGPLAVMRASNVVATNLQIIQENVAFTYGLEFAGDAHNVSIDNVTVAAANGNNGTLIWLSGANVAEHQVKIANINIIDGSFNLLVHLLDYGNLQLKGVYGSYNPMDNTQPIVNVDTTNGGCLRLDDIYLTVPSSSKGANNVFTLNANGSLIANNFKLSAVDAVNIGQSANTGIAIIKAGGNTIELNDCKFDTKSLTLINEYDKTQNNTVIVKRGYMRGASTFPALTPVSTLTIDSFKVDSVFNIGNNNTDSMLHLYLKSNQTWILRNLESYSQGKYGYNKTLMAGIIKTDSASFNTLTACSIRIENVTHQGGDSSASNRYQLVAYANGVNVSEPWNPSAAAYAFIKAARLNINDSASGIQFPVVATTSVQPIVDSGYNGGPNVAFWPGSKMLVKARDGNNLTVPFFYKEADNNGSPNPNYHTMYFNGAPTVGNFELVTL